MFFVVVRVRVCARACCGGGVRNSCSAYVHTYIAPPVAEFGMLDGASILDRSRLITAAHLSLAAKTKCAIL